MRQQSAGVIVNISGCYHPSSDERARNRYINVSTCHMSHVTIGNWAAVLPELSNRIDIFAKLQATFYWVLLLANSYSISRYCQLLQLSNYIGVELRYRKFEFKERTRKTFVSQWACA